MLRALANQKIAGAENGCTRLSRLTLDGNKAHCGPLRRLADSLRIGVVPKFKDVDVSRLDASAIGPIEDIVYNDAERAAWHPDRATPGNLVAVQQLDGAGRTITRFTGDPFAWMAPFMRGGMVGHFRDPR